MKKFFAVFISILLVAAAFCAVPASAEGEAGGKVIYYWSFDGDCKDYSHREFDEDYNDMYPDFGEGVLGQAVEVTGCPITTDVFPEDISLSAYTVSYWFNWSGDTTGWGITCAIGAKGQPLHFEINTNSSDGQTAQLGFYNDGEYGAVIGTVNANEWYNITATVDASRTVVYMNGTVLFDNHGYDVSTLTAGDQSITFGALQDQSLMFSGLIDEAVLANNVMDDAQIQSLYSEPEKAITAIKAEIEALYPEGYVRATPTPAPTATPEPTEVPATDVPASTTAPTDAPKAPDTADKSGSKSANPLIFIIIAAVVVIAVVAIIIILKKKKK